MKDDREKKSGLERTKRKRNKQKKIEVHSHLVCVVLIFFFVLNEQKPFWFKHVFYKVHFKFFLFFFWSFVWVITAMHRWINIEKPFCNILRISVQFNYIFLILRCIEHELLPTRYHVCTEKNTLEFQVRLIKYANYCLENLYC